MYELDFFLLQRACPIIDIRIYIIVNRFESTWGLIRTSDVAPIDRFVRRMELLK